MKLALVTATIDAVRSKPCIESWRRSGDPPLYAVVQQPCPEEGWIHPDPRCWVYRTPEILGVVPAFALGVQRALEDGAEIIACFHDDLLIEAEEQRVWADRVLDWFDRFPRVGLIGFGGARGLGDSQLYRIPYHPMQLARQDFVSNMRHAEAHGRRATSQPDWRWPLTPERVACLDGFSQIGRRNYWMGMHYDDHVATHGRQVQPRSYPNGPPHLLQRMAEWDLVHHAYDAALGCFAARLGWEVWMLPIACHHHGGLTAVGDPRYHAWADAQKGDFEGSGDQKFWTESHQLVYDHFRDVLPIRT